MKFIIIPLSVICLCQIIKLLIAFFENRKFSFNSLIWEGFWVGKFPSSHAAVMTSSIYLLVKYASDKTVVGFAIIISLLIMYGLLEDKKRQIILEEYFSKSDDPQLREIASEKRLLDFSGHKLKDIMAGVFTGIICTFLLDIFIN